MLAIGTGEGPPDDLTAGIELADRHPCFRATVGVHPHDASKVTEDVYMRLGELLKHPKVVGYGEIGLDYFHNFSPREVQQEVFVRQMEIAREAKLPIVIHTRDAWEDTFRLIERHWPKEGGGVFHCFSGGENEMRRAVALGFHIGIGGVLTFPRSEALREAARLAPAERLLMETDAPYLAPVPFRGKRCEPAHTMQSAAKLAEVRGVTLEEIDRLTTANFEWLFGTLH
jgi:TatD DNase family protein